MSKDGKSRKSYAYSFNSDFWSEQRVKKGLTLKQIARTLGVSRSAVGNYFSGKTIPHDTFIVRVCDLLGVDHDKGMLEFQRANRAYNSGAKKSSRSGSSVAFSTKRPYVKKGQRPQQPKRLDNFWINKKNEFKLTNKEIGEMLKLNANTVWAYLSGYLIPPQKAMEDICDLFGVSITRGKQEFELAHKQYEEDHSGKYYAPATKPEPAAEPKVEPAAEPKVEPAAEPDVIIYEHSKPAKPTNYAREYAIASCLYKSIPSYEKFITLLTIIENNSSNILEAAYKKVDFDTYLELVSAVREVDTEDDDMMKDAIFNLLKR